MTLVPYMSSGAVQFICARCGTGNNFREIRCRRCGLPRPTRVKGEGVVVGNHSSTELGGHKHAVGSREGGKGESATERAQGSGSGDGK